MIKCHLSRMMGEKRLKIADVARATGVNRGTITRLYHENAQRVDFDTLETLCRYFNCEIGDLLIMQGSGASSEQGRQHG